MTAKLEARGKIDIFEFLSQNETKAMYYETEAEGLLTMIRKLIDAKELDEKHGVATGQVSRYRKLLSDQQAFAFKTQRLSAVMNSEHTVDMLMENHRLGPHIRDSKITTVTWLQRMAGHHGGVRASSDSIIHVWTNDIAAHQHIKSRRQHHPNEHYAKGDILFCARD